MGRLFAVLNLTATTADSETVLGKFFAGDHERFTGVVPLAEIISRNVTFPNKTHSKRKIIIVYFEGSF